MKNLKILLLSIFVIIGLNSCQDEDDLVFTAAPDAEFTFVNTFLDDYMLNANATSNIAERFVYNPANFNTPSPVNYVLENSISLPPKHHHLRYLPMQWCMSASKIYNINNIIPCQTF